MGGGLIGQRWAYWVVAAAMGLTLLSLSRSALAAEFAVVALARLNLRSFRGWLVAIGATAVALALALSRGLLLRPAAPPVLPRRHSERRGFSINVTGRNALWSANWGWFTEKP